MITTIALANPSITSHINYHIFFVMRTLKIYSITMKLFIRSPELTHLLNASLTFDQHLPSSFTYQLLVTSILLSASMSLVSFVSTYT